MTMEGTTGLYRSIHTQPQAVRELLADWDGPNRAAEKLSRTGRVLLAGIGTSFHAATVGEYLLRFAGADAWAVRSFEFVHYPRPLRPDDGVIVISHRGSKLHGTLALQRAVESGVITVGITGKNSKMQDADITIETVEQDPSSTHSQNAWNRDWHNYPRSWKTSYLVKVQYDRLPRKPWRIHAACTILEQGRTLLRGQRVRLKQKRRHM